MKADANRLKLSGKFKSKLEKNLKTSELKRYENKLQKAIFNSFLQAAKLQKADLRWVNLEMANTKGSHYDEETQFPERIWLQATWNNGIS